MGRRLRDAEVLGTPEEVFHLRLDELEAVDDPARLTGSDKDKLATLCAPGRPAARS
jgi:hypothetical protein